MPDLFIKFEYICGIDERIFGGHASGCPFSFAARIKVLLIHYLLDKEVKTDETTY